MPGLTQASFWKGVNALKRMAQVEAAAWPDDTPEKRARRMAEGLVLPERFNAHYLPHYFRDGGAPFHAELYRALEESPRTAVTAPRGHAKSTVLTFAYTVHQVACGHVLRAWTQGQRDSLAPELRQAIGQVMREELQRREAQAWADLVALRALVAARGSAGLVDQLAQAEATHAAARARLAVGGDPAHVAEIPLYWDPYIQIIAVTDDLASEFTAAIKLEMERNELLRADWGKFVADPAADGDWVANDIRVKAFGMLSGIRGGKHGPYRPTLAILDDPDSKRTVATAELRNGQETTLSAEIEFGLEPNTSRILAIGTSVHEDCLIRRLRNRDRYPEWRIIIYKAIQDDGTALWESRFPLDKLQKLERTRPEYFATEMMDCPPSQGGRPFTNIQHYARAEFAGARLGKVLWFDPSLGRTEKSDYQAVVVLRGPTKEGLLLVHRAELLRIGDPMALVDRVNQIYAEEQPDLAGIETIGFQCLLQMALQSRGAKAGLFPAWHQLDKQTESKDLRIRGMAPLINNGVMRLPDDGSCRQLEQQLSEYPSGKKDGPDALEMALRQIRQESMAHLAGQIRHIPGRAASFGVMAGAWSASRHDPGEDNKAGRGGCY